MIWGCYMKLGVNMWFKKFDQVIFENEAWEKIIDEAEKSGINMIVLDLGEGVDYASHPELANPGAWSRERVRDEVKRLKEKGITLIPKLNFSATHHLWLGDYGRMMGTSTYYHVCRDLIYEVCRLFDNPPYVHLGMDEEGAAHFFNNFDLVSYRQGELLWHDFQFLCDCVRDCGSIPWAWGDLQKFHTEEFNKRVKPGSVILSPWYYFGIKKEHFTSIEYMKQFNPDLEKEPYKSMYIGMTYMEDNDYTYKSVRYGVKAANDGYPVVPTVSVWGRNEFNTPDTVEHYKNNVPKENLYGFLTAPWKQTTIENVPAFIESFKLLKDAREKYFVDCK